MKIKIWITKSVLDRAKMCGVLNVTKVVNNCGIAVAVRDIFPYASVTFEDEVLKPIIYPFPDDDRFIRLPNSAGKFMCMFDDMDPEQRVKIPEQSFTIDVPDWVIDRIQIPDLYRILSESKTLELAENFETI